MNPLPPEDASLFESPFADRHPDPNERSTSDSAGGLPRSLHDEPWRHDVMVLASVPGVGSVGYRRLVEHFGSATAVLDASTERLLEVPGVGVTIARSIVRTAQGRDELVRRCREDCLRAGIDWMVLGDDDYPRSLARTTDPPPLLFLRGERPLLDRLGVAIVGSRHATRYGLRVAERLARGLSDGGIAVVSGLARGIDSAAHRGALEANGRTIAVLGGELDRIHPEEHRDLAERIAVDGCLVSEHPPGFPPRGGVFPQRNRVIAGLCPAVIVVEAAARSGALITARHALEQNREVFAVPGPIDSPVSVGCHHLIRDGAHLIESVRDLYDVIGPLAAPQADAAGRVVSHAAEIRLNPQERAVLERLSDEPITIDQLVRESGLAASRAWAAARRAIGTRNGRSARGTASS
jgi:DNA processing protein